MSAEGDIVIRCPRCTSPLPLDAAEVMGHNTPTGFRDVETWERTEHMPTSPPSGEDLPLVIVPPPNCMIDPDDPDLLIHRGCATRDELAEDEGDS